MFSYMITEHLCIYVQNRTSGSNVSMVFILEYPFIYRRKRGACYFFMCNNDKMTGIDAYKERALKRFLNCFNLLCKHFNWDMTSHTNWEEPAGTGGQHRSWNLSC